MARSPATVLDKPAKAVAKSIAASPASLRAPTTKQVALRLAATKGVWATLTSAQKAKVLNVKGSEVSGRKR